MSSERSKPTKRIRWATQRAPAHKGDRIRQSVVDRFHRRKASEDRKAEIADGDFTKAEGDISVPEPGTNRDLTGRRIFFNTPLPDDARDEDGHPLMRYARNKIRTAKYTPLTFLPKNLWFQFHNVANVYFLFIVILSVRDNFIHSHLVSVILTHESFRFFPSSAPKMLHSVLYHSLQSFS